MSIAMYKADQGYWTRLVSAVAGGLLVAWFASWLWGRLQSVTVPVSEATGQPVVDPILIQGGVTALVLLVGGAAVYWLVYMRRRTSEFLIATDGEMKKVNWSTRREIIGSTWVVISISVILAICLLIVDILFSLFFREVVGVLK